MVGTLNDCVVNDVFYQCQMCYAYFPSIVSWSSHSVNCLHLTSSSPASHSFKLVSFPQTKLLIRKLPEDVFLAVSFKRRKVNGGNVAVKREPVVQNLPERAVEVEEVHFEDRIMISSDGNAIHCTGESLDPSYHRRIISNSSSCSTSPFPNDQECSDYNSSVQSDGYLSENSISDNDTESSRYNHLSNRERKREQNRMAARIYRRKMYLEFKSHCEQEQKFQKINDQLKREKDQLENDLRGMRGLVLDRVREFRSSRIKIKKEKQSDQWIIPDKGDPAADVVLSKHATTAIGQGVHSFRTPSKTRVHEKRGRPRLSSVKCPISDRKERKKLQNKSAAVRYRRKCQAELILLLDEVDKLDETNKDLKKQMEELKRQVSWTRGLVRERLIEQRKRITPRNLVKKERKSILLVKEFFE